jgi:hypothetical protein
VAGDRGSQQARLLLEGYLEQVVGDGERPVARRLLPLEALQLA